MREPESQKYLEEQGLEATLTGDPAFSLPITLLSDRKFANDGPRLVLNVSPYVYRDTEAAVADKALLDFVERRLAEGYAIQLLSHVNTGTSSDSSVMRKLFAPYIADGRVEFVSEEYSASQFKGIVAAADVVMAVRTHVTIAGFSSATPTVSIGYSAKAPRLNRFLFGHDDYVIETRDLNSEALENTFQAVLRDKPRIITTLEKKSAGLRGDFKALCESMIAQ